MARRAPKPDEHRLAAIGQVPLLEEGGPRLRHPLTLKGLCDSAECGQPDRRRQAPSLVRQEALGA